MDKVTVITTIVGSIVAVASLASAVLQYRRKVHLEIFREYSDRYNEIITPEILCAWQAALRGDQARWPELTQTMVKYLNLVWEEFYLSREGVIPRRLWRIWLPGIRHVLSSDFAIDTMKKYDFHFASELTCGTDDVATHTQKVRQPKPTTTLNGGTGVE